MSTCVRVCMCVFVLECECVFVYPCVCACIYVCVHAYVSACMCMSVHVCALIWTVQCNGKCRERFHRHRQCELLQDKMLL